MQYMYIIADTPYEVSKDYALFNVIIHYLHSRFYGLSICDKTSISD